MESPLIVEPWCVKELSLPPEGLKTARETIFAVGNGYIGLRGFFEEVSSADVVQGEPHRDVEISGTTQQHSCRATYLSNIYDERMLQNAGTTQPFSFGACGRECFIVPVIDAATFEIRIGGEVIDTNKGTVLSHTRHLNLQTGELTRRLHWTSPNGREIVMMTSRFASLADENIIGIRIQLTIINSRNSEVRITSYTQLPTENHLHLEEATIDFRNYETLALVRARTVNSYKDVAAVALERCSVVVAPTEHPVLEGGSNSLGGSNSFHSPNAAGSGSSWTSTPSDRVTSTGTPPHAQRTPVRPTSQQFADGIHSTFSLMTLHHNASICCEKFVAFGTELDASDEDVAENLKEKVTAAAAAGYDANLQRSARELQLFWQTADVQVTCKDPAVQGTLRYNMLQLRMSASTTRPGRFPTKGLTGDLFGGRQSWETEVFILPFFTHAYPAAARSLIEFRIATLPNARERGIDFDLRKGAVYPSRTINGGENSFSMPCALQLHVNADIAFSIERYFESTQDVELMVHGAAAVVLATAVVWIEWGTWDRDVFHLRNVTGPDEYNVLVSDNYYTNLMAQRHMRFACDLAELMKLQHPKEWAAISEEFLIDDGDLQKMKKAAAQIALPYDPFHRIHLQDASFMKKKEWNSAAEHATPQRQHASRQPQPHQATSININAYHPITVFRHRVCKSADVVLAAVLLPDSFTRDEKLANFQFYENLTAHDSSLTASTFSIVAADLGLHEKAIEYFYRSLNVDIKNLIGNTSGGMHAACMAGSWSCVVSGFAGMKVVKGVIQFYPWIPDGWDEYKFSVRFGATTIGVAVSRRAVVYSIIEGSKIRIVHANSTRVHLQKGRPVTVKLLRDVRSFDFDAVVFDMDSIIHNVEDDHYVAWEMTLNPLFAKHVGDEVVRRPFTTEQYLAYIRHGPSGPGRKHGGILRLLQTRKIELPIGEPTDPPSTNSIYGLVNLKLLNFRDVVKQRGLNVKNGAVSLINELRQNGIAVGCVSASRNGAWLMNQTPQLHHIIDHFFDAVAADDSHLSWRPELDYFVHCTKKLEAIPSRTVLVLDGADGFSKTSLQQFCFVASTIGGEGVMDVKDLTKLTTDILDDAVSKTALPNLSFTGLDAALGDQYGQGTRTLST